MYDKNNRPINSEDIASHKILNMVVIPIGNLVRLGVYYITIILSGHESSKINIWDYNIDVEQTLLVN